MVSISENQRFRLPGCQRVRREEYILERAAGKRVLHVGACDSPYWKERLETDSLLHTKLSGAGLAEAQLLIDEGELSPRSNCSGSSNP